MKVKVKSFIMLFIIILILMECEFNYMVPLGPLSDLETVKLIKVFICVSAFFLYQRLSNKVPVARELRIVQGLFAFIIPINTLVSYASGMKMIDAVLNSSHYFFIFLIEPICYLLFDKKNRKQLITIILASGCLTLIMRSIMAFYYHYNNHIELFPRLSIGAGSKIRYSTFFGYNMLRVYPSCFGAVVLFGFAYIALESEKKLYKILTSTVVGLVMAYYILVYQSRGYTVIFGIELFILLLAKRYNKNRQIKNLVKYIIAFSAFYYVMSSEFVKNLLDSFSVHSELGESTSIRLVGIGLVFSKIITSFPFGIGGNNVFDSIAGLIYADDYGCLDFILKNNILGLCVYIVLCKYIISWLYMTRRSKYNLLMMTLAMVFIASMLAVDNFLPRKIGAVPFVIAAFEYCRLEATYYAD